MIDTKCKFGSGIEVILGAEGFTNFMSAIPDCKSELKQSEVYVLDTTAPTKNLCESSMNKFTIGLLLTLEDPSKRDKKWGFWSTYSLEKIKLKIYGVNLDSNPKQPTFQTCQTLQKPQLARRHN